MLGGVYSAEELKEAAARDKVVAAHYAVLQTSRLRRVSLESDRLAYVSFRVNNSIFWTKGRVALARGEQVLSDGEALVRARCGNRISEFPRVPVLPEEPAEVAMEEVDRTLGDAGRASSSSSLEDLAPSSSLELVQSLIASELQLGVPFDELALSLPPLPGGDVSLPATLSPSQEILPVQGDPFQPGDAPFAPVIPAPPPAVVPEPNSVILLATTLLLSGLVFRGRWRG